ncbi:EscU/YscU/HrcU family type III secretion system export apparatus switch protein [Salmonella enterica subsp. salamae]|nr:EscU/YscU/HrcU family type III secretion system export apparatus switch protein [Salmonella enterica subsp. salamae]ECJ2280061.1 EscU/YscU/HrcU family type III secretion system export apparatus switch protein [Salmonella enterica subsp. salamae]HCC0886932.1 EscU/YscU/HrcU family type III secretion system export apparatus switch protein [Salmonella enterica]
MSEKTEQPTEKKLRDGREEGQVVKSIEITSLLQLIALFLYFHFFTEKIILGIVELIILSLQLINKPFSYALTQLNHSLAYSFASATLFLGGGIIIATVGSVFLQVGLVIASKAIGFKSDHINPVNNFKQIFSLHSVVELCKSILKVTMLSLIFAFFFYYYASSFRALPYCGLACALPVIIRLITWMWAGVMAFYIVIGIMDYSFQYYKIRKDLKMSKEDVKQEHKDLEGDPQMKTRRREMQSEIQSGSLAQSVKQSVAVVRNPTHIAVCLGYHPTDMPVPRVLEKGSNTLANYIVTLAERNFIPVVENVDLARALFYDVNRGDKIPETLFEPVAALLRIVMKIDYAHSGEN